MTLPKQRSAHTCPHCEAKAVTYTSRKLSALVTEQYVQCTNLECGCQYVVQVGVVRMTVPSAMPAADVNLPLVARRGNDIVVTRGDADHHQDNTAPIRVLTHGHAAATSARATH